ncbi:LysR substrate-binding domain-containing protein [Telmatospirillum sp.]|uniref:LysR substrate-binding domain-containing protein n=1 Tax=Telmatospirillum sp. TaxID=2079197 RepID=UPI002847CDCD|nr:LysR substrate-binding domain-containing protein [Telmatospirillum sp.]MDR3439765.1 LysR substrate-binding domain-containing protein [Telmatospirillum sp.]
MRNQRLPLVALRAFESAGRTGSFRAAAAELNLTPSAISHAIHKLEDTLGTTLFKRNGRAILLTPDGETLKRHIGSAFEELRRGMEVVSARGSTLLRLHSAPSFAAQWLTARLIRFHAQCPDIEVRLAAGTDYTRFLTDEFDADIIYGAPRQEGLVVLPLGEETVTPLCTPELAKTIETPADLLQHVLIESDNKQVRWSAWFSANGLVAPLPHGMRFDRSFLAIAAAVDGLGVTLESTMLAEREIASGRLVRPLDGIATDIRYVGHYLVFPRSGGGHRRALRSFISWLQQELGVDFDADLAIGR